MLKGSSLYLVSNIGSNPNEPSMKCELCKKEHDGRYGTGRFCNSFCSHSSSTKNKRKEISKKVSNSLLKTKNCEICNEIFYPRQVLSRKFCLKHKRKRLKDLSFEELLSDRSRKSRLLLERGRKCEICFRDTWNGKEIPIEIDHISGNSDDNRKENLRLICPNCHAQTSTYKSKNKASKTRRIITEKYPRRR